MTFATRQDFIEGRARYDGPTFPIKAPKAEPCFECGTQEVLCWRYYGKVAYCPTCQPEEIEDLL